MRSAAESASTSYRGALGAGGMGVVYRVQHVETGGVYALKTLSVTANDEALARFRREGEAQAVAPTRVGVYAVEWRMVHEEVRWFGPTIRRSVRVAPSAE